MFCQFSIARTRSEYKKKLMENKVLVWLDLLNSLLGPTLSLILEISSLIDDSRILDQAKSITWFGVENSQHKGKKIFMYFHYIWPLIVNLQVNLRLINVFTNQCHFHQKKYKRAISKKRTYKYKFTLEQKPKFVNITFVGSTWAYT